MADTADEFVPILRQFLPNAAAAVTRPVAGPRAARTAAAPAVPDASRV